MSFLESWSFYNAGVDADDSQIKVGVDGDFNPYELEKTIEGGTGSIAVGSFTDVGKSRDSQETDVTQTWNRSLVLCISLHLVVFLVHVALLAIWMTQTERLLLIPLQLSDVISSAINSGLQILVIVVSTWMVAVTQPLALRRQLMERQTLTSLADKSSAWEGLGQASSAVCENFRTPAARMYTLAIAVYFTAIAVLQVAAPTLFSTVLIAVAFNGTGETIVGTPLLYDETEVAGWTQNGYSLAGANPMWLPASAAINLLPINASATLPGLFKNRVYETLVTTLTFNATALVNYTDFHVDCGMISGATVPQTVPVILHADSDGRTWSSIEFSVSTMSNGTNFTISDHIPNLEGSNGVDGFWNPTAIRIRFPGAQQSVQKGYEALGRNILLYSVFEDEAGWIRDSSGNGGSSFTVQAVNGSGGIHPVHIQVIGCSMTTSSGTTLVDAVTNKLITDNPPLNKSTNLLWQDWEAKSTSDKQLEDFWSSMFVPSSSMALWNPGFNTSYSSNWDCDPGTKRNGSCHIPTVVEGYATGYVFGSATRGPDGLYYRPSERNATLEKLQTALSEATAMMMWSAARVPFMNDLRSQSLTDGSAGPSSSFISYPRQGQALVTDYMLTGQLRINLNSVILGAASAFLMLVIVAAILLPKGQNGHISSPYATKSKNMERLGLLETCRLMDPKLQIELDSCPLTDRKALRRAGMIEIGMVDNRLMILGAEERNQLIRDV